MKKILGFAAIAALSVGGIAVAASGAPSSSASPVPVAYAMAVSGDLAVNDAAVPSATVLNAGDVLVASEGAQVTFADGCSVQVASTEPFAVLAASPCMTGAATAAVHTVALQTPPPPPPPPVFGGIAGLGVGGTVAVGTLAFVAGVGLIDQVTDDDDDEPVSP